MLVILENAKVILGISEKCGSYFVSFVMACRCYEKYILWYDCGRKWFHELSGLNACFL
jgi:uncharacterized OB-fold protein